MGEKINLILGLYDPNNLIGMRKAVSYNEAPTGSHKTPTNYNSRPKPTKKPSKSKHSYYAASGTSTGKYESSKTETS
jgi:hypothetical protein